MAYKKHKLVAVAGAIWIAIASATTPAFAEPRPLSWENWKTDFTNTNIDVSSIISGGPPKDGIAAINNPKFVSIEEAGALSDRDPVIGVEINGDARAYPLSVLMRHEIANDVIGGQAVTVTFCPLCNSAVIFDAMIDGKKHDFGTTGRLRNSDLVMYDRQTETWWQQFTGEALIGEYVGKRLKMIPSRMESFANFKKRFPNGKVLAGETGSTASLSSYGINPYTGYDSAAKPFLYNGEMPEGIDPMERVVVVQDKEAPLAVAVLSVREKGKMSVGGYEITWSEGQASALDTSRISDGREVGNVVVTRMKDGKALDVVYDVTFAFVAHAFMPDTPIVK
ncbi:MAG: DUF3179 domain-containing protein [Rhizobiaceae bacterium]|nr:DUF3179 domain-containing protein [Rhizobiaceae bacterium]